jgi:DNA-binding NtrC family response regulator
MDGFGTVLIVAADLTEWDPIAEQLRTGHNYRVYVVRTAAEVQSLLADLHVDLVLANEGESGSNGLALLTKLRTSHPDIIRVLALESRSDSATRAIAQAAIFQFLATRSMPNRSVSSSSAVLKPAKLRGAIAFYRASSKSPASRRYFWTATRHPSPASANVSRSLSISARRWPISAASQNSLRRPSCQS